MAKCPALCFVCLPACVGTGQRKGADFPDETAPADVRRHVGLHGAVERCVQTCKMASIMFRAADTPWGGKR